MPSWYQTGTPLHFHSSVTSGSASFTSVRSRLSVFPRQSSSSLIRASISCEGDLLFCDPAFFIAVLLMSPEAPTQGGHRHRHSIRPTTFSSAPRNCRHPALAPL